MQKKKARATSLGGDAAIHTSRVSFSLGKCRNTFNYMHYFHIFRDIFKICFL